MEQQREVTARTTQQETKKFGNETWYSGYTKNAPNYGVISNKVKHKLFREHKFLCIDWDVLYSKDPRRVCGQTKGLVVYPPECLEEEGGKEKYWKDYLMPMINKKFSTLKGNNATQNMRGLFIGKTLQKYLYVQLA